MFKRNRFLSDPTGFAQTGDINFDSPLSPAIPALELDSLDELEDLAIPPSTLFEQNEELISQFFTDCTIDKEGPELSFMRFTGATKRGRSQSYSRAKSERRIFDYLALNEFSP